MDDGTLMMSYEPIAELPNFFRSIISNVASREEDVYFMLSEVERLGNISWRNFQVILKSKRGRQNSTHQELKFEMLRQKVLDTIRGVKGFHVNEFCLLPVSITSVFQIFMCFNEINNANNLEQSVPLFNKILSYTIQMAEILLAILNVND